MARYESATTIINDAAIEVGLLPVVDPFSSTDGSFIQLCGLLNSAGRELVEMYPWEYLQRPFEFITQFGDTGIYDLPDDFDHMINQTGWNHSSRTPVGGPLSVQQWAYVQGQGLGSITLYANFILSQGQMVLYPQPPPLGITLKFYYISRNWVLTAGDPDPVGADRVTMGADLVMYDPILVVKFLKVKFLSAKGLDIAVASRDFDMTFQARTSMNRGAPLLSMIGPRRLPCYGAAAAPVTGVTITLQPVSQSITDGDSVSFVVAAISGNGSALVYQWEQLVLGVWTPMVNGAPVSGVSTTTLTINPVTLGMTGDDFRCVVSNDNDSKTSNVAELTVTSASSFFLLTEGGDRIILEDSSGFVLSEAA